MRFRAVLVITSEPPCKHHLLSGIILMMLKISFLTLLPQQNDLQVGFALKWKDAQYGDRTGQDVQTCVLKD